MKVQQISTPNGYRFLVLDNDYKVIEPIKNYLKFLDRLNKSENTLKNYAHHLKLYCDFLEEYEMDILQMNSSEEYNALEVISQYIYWLRYGVLEDETIINITPIRENNTINILVDVVLDFYEYLAGQGLLNELDVYKKQRVNNQFKNFLFEMNVPKEKRSSIFKLKETPKEPKAITREQYNQLIDACNQTRDKILLAFMFEGAMRIGEALGTQIEDVKPRQNKIEIIDRRNNENHTFVKNGDEGSVILPNYVFKWIQDYILNDISDYESNFLFLTLYGENKGKPLEYETVNKLFDSLSKKVGFDVTPHMLRHGYATERSAAGWDIKKIQHVLRHKQIQTTSQYIEIFNENELNDTIKFYKDKGIDIGVMFNG